MRPENSSKLWLKTRCEWSRESTLLSGVTPFSPDAMADCEMPLDDASVLKSSSHASKLPVPQDAANADVAGAIRTALTAIINPKFIGKMSTATAAKTRLRLS